MTRVREYDIESTEMVQHKVADIHPNYGKLGVDNTVCIANTSTPEFSEAIKGNERGMSQGSVCLGTDVLAEEEAGARLALLQTGASQE